MDLQLAVRKGKRCVETAILISNELDQGKAKEASLKLTELTKDGAELAKEVEELAKRLEIVKDYNIKKEEEIQKVIGEYASKEQEKQAQRSNVESRLASQRSILQQNQNRLDEAERELNNAIDKRRRKEKEADNIRVGSAVGGAVLGIATFGIGFLAGAATGAAVGAGIGQLINELKKDEERARREVDRRRSDLSSAQSDIRSNEQQIQSIQSEINQLSQQMSGLKQQRLKYHEEAGKLREVISFLHDTVHFWSLFKQLSDSGVDRASLLKKIVSKAQSKADLSILQKRATKKVAISFIDTWEQMKTMAEEGSSQFTLKIEFKCSKCCGDFTDLPYEEVTCSSCYKDNAIGY